MLNPRPIHLESGRDVNRYLDDWADGHLIGPERWADLLAVTRDWTDYSARNQILLAAHGALGPVAGIETWRLVPSGDHVCAIRAGEHGLPVRVPVTASATQRDPHVGRARPTQSAVAGWEWRSVFCIEQLARRPDAEQILRARPETLTGPDGREGFLSSARAAAKTTVRGRLPKLDDPLAILADAARRLPRNDRRPPLTDELAAQAAWLVAERVGLANGTAPGFDPIDLAPRERWELALDVLDPSRRLLAVLGKDLGVDLLESPLPRMLVDDDRVVGAARRNRLPRSTLGQLPVGTWVDVGPYTPDEWEARGETANGRGAYLRLNTTAYLVTAERADGAIWRLEDTRAKTGAGLLAEGEADTLEQAQATAMHTMTTRYPQLADVPAPPPPRPSHDPQLPIADATDGWEPIPARPDAESRRRVLDHDVVIYVMPTGDAWAPMTQSGRSAMIEPAGDPTPTRDEAMSVALLAGRRLAREAATETRVDLGLPRGDDDLGAPSAARVPLRLGHAHR
jgi:nitroreductase